MRKGILFLILSAGVVLAPLSFAEEKAPKMLGAGAIISTSPYHGVGNRVLSVPLVSWDYKGFYIRGVEAGNLSVNSHSSVRYWTPFGGYKQSGLGRELGPDAPMAFTEEKNVFIAH